MKNIIRNNDILTDYWSEWDSQGAHPEPLKANSYNHQQPIPTRISHSHLVLEQNRWVAQNAISLADPVTPTQQSHPVLPVGRPRPIHSLGFQPDLSCHALGQRAGEEAPEQCDDFRALRGCYDDFRPSVVSLALVLK